MNTLFLPDEAASITLGKRLAGVLVSPFVLTLSGQLGSGKTTVMRAMLRALGVQSAIKSPTFSLVESYPCGEMVVHHFDLYRIAHPEELEFMGFRDFFSKKSVCCIEWPEHAGRLLMEIDLNLSLELQGSGRVVKMLAKTPAGEAVVQAVLGA